MMHDIKIMNGNIIITDKNKTVVFSGECGNISIEKEESGESKIKERINKDNLICKFKVQTLGDRLIKETRFGNYQAVERLNDFRKKKIDLVKEYICNVLTNAGDKDISFNEPGELLMKKFIKYIKEKGIRITNIPKGIYFVYIPFKHVDIERCEGRNIEYSLEDNK